MNKYLPEELWISLEENSKRKFTRKSVKNAAMPSSYGSVAEPLFLFGENSPELKAFFQAMRDNVPAVLDIPAELESMWNNKSGEYRWRKFFNPDSKNPYWARCVTKPDQYRDPVRVKNIYGLKGSFSYLLDSRGEPSNYSIPIIANCIQSFEADICAEMIRRCFKSGFNILTIHKLIVAL